MITLDLLQTRALVGDKDINAKVPVVFDHHGRQLHTSVAQSSPPKTAAGPEAASESSMTLGSGDAAPKHQPRPHPASARLSPAVHDDRFGFAAPTASSARKSMVIPGASSARHGAMSPSKGDSDVALVKSAVETNVKLIEIARQTLAARAAELVAEKQRFEKRFDLASELMQYLFTTQSEREVLLEQLSAALGLQTDSVASPNNTGQHGHVATK